MSGKKSSSNVEDKTKMLVLRAKLFQWTCERHATNQPLNKEIIGDKAIDFSIELGLKGLKISKSWVTKFLKKHGFSPSLNSSYGPVFKDYREWIELMRHYTSQYRYKNIFQVDEMGMYYDISPEKIPQSADYITCENGENRENRVTILLCCNASGMEKLPPLICGKFGINSAFDNCQLYSNHNAWLTADIFKIWLSQLNAQMLALNRKILLLLNRTRVHELKGAILSNVNLLFFPKNFPKNLQPLKASIFHHVKINYRHSYTQKMLEPNFNWTITDTITNIVNAWENVPKEFILSSFRKTNFRSDNDRLQIFFPEWDILNPGISFRSYVTFDDNLSVSYSSTRRLKRSSQIETEFNRSGCHAELVELGDSNSEEDVIEEMTCDSSMNKHDLNLPDELIADDKICEMETRDMTAAVVSTMKIGSQNSTELKLQSCNFQSCSRLLSDAVISYVVKNGMTGEVLDDVPDVMDLQDSESKNRNGTGDVVDKFREEGDDKGAPITRKRFREESNQDDELNDDSREPKEKKKQMGKQGWSDIYEHSFVFGAPNSSQGSTSVQADIKSVLLHPTINLLQMNDDTEKKSIFTISHAASSGSHNQLL